MKYNSAVAVTVASVLAEVACSEVPYQTALLLRVRFPKVLVFG